MSQQSVQQSVLPIRGGVGRSDQDEFDTIFIHYPRHKVIVCKICETGIVPQQVRRHLIDQHRWMAKRVREAALRHSQSIEGLATSLEAVIHPESSIRVIPGLPVFENAFKCIECGFIQRTVRNIQEHCKITHNWTNANRGGRPLKNEDRQAVPWKTGIKCQQFFKAVGWQRWFEVEAEQVQVPAEEDNLYQRMRKAAMDAKARRKEEQANKDAVAGPPERYDMAKWIERTQWAQHLQGISKSWLCQMISAPNEEQEGALLQACRQMEAMIIKAQSVVQPDVVGQPVLFYINRKEFDKEAQSERPFYSNQMAKTIDKYTAVWVRVLRYAWRGHAMTNREREAAAEADAQTDGWDESESESEPESAGGEGEDEEHRRPDYVFSREQVEILEEIKAGAEEMWQSKQSSRQAAQRQQRAGRQMQTKKKTEEEEDTEETEWLQAKLLAFCIAMLSQEARRTEFDSVLISGLAVVGINERSGGWIGPLHYTPTLAAVNTVGKMLVVYSAYQQHNQEVEQLHGQGMPVRDAEMQATPIFSIVQQMMHAFMGVTPYGGETYPMAYVLRLKTYGMSVRFNTAEEGVIGWEGDKVVFGYNGFSMDALRGMVHGMVASTRDSMLKLMFMKLKERDEAPPSIPWRQLVDVQAESRARWNFFDDERNQQVLGELLGESDREWFLFDRLLRQNTEIQHITHEFITARQGQQQTEEWNMQRLQRYAGEIDEFKEALAVLVHMTGGQPGRGSELLSIQYANSDNQAQRGVYIQDGTIVLVTGYHKGFGLSGQAKIIHRFLPVEVAELLFYYLWLIAPFWQTTADTVGVESEDKSTFFIWAPKAESTYAGKRREQMEEQQKMKRAEKRKRSMSLSSRSNRAFASSRISEADMRSQTDTDRQTRVWPSSVFGFSSPAERRTSSRGRRDSWASVGLEESEWPEESEEMASSSRAAAAEDSVGAMKAQIARIFHEREWDGERLRRQLQKASNRWMQQSINIMAWRHISIAIYRRYCDQDKLADRMMDEIAREEAAEEEADAAFDMQAGHSTRMAEMIYGGIMSEHRDHLPTRMIGFQRASEAWHRFLRFESALHPQFGAGGREVRTMMAQARDVEYRRWASLRQVNIRAQLKGMVGEHAEFRGVQKQALEAIMTRKSPVVAIMGTGGGKSLLFMLPAACSDGVTVVVVPLISLRGDLQRRCKEVGIDCVEWSSTRPADGASIVLVTPESAVSDIFGHFLNRQRAAGKLDRIFIDECHAVLDARDGFRTRMQQLRKIVLVETQVVYATATLAINDESDWVEAMGLTLEDKAVIGSASDNRQTEVSRRIQHWFRGSTVRANIQYETREYDAREGDAAVVKFVLGTQTKLKESVGGNIVVYCDTIAAVKRVAEETGGIAFFSQVADTEGKRRIVQRLIAEEGLIFVSTNALGLGVDAPHIRCVVHYGTVRKLRDYAQESGRAGRDGKKSKAIIMVERSDGRAGGVAERARRMGVEEEMVEFITTRGCKRAVLDRVMDGVERTEGCRKVLNEVAREELCMSCRQKREEERRAEKEARREWRERGERRERRELETQRERREQRGIVGGMARGRREAENREQTRSEDEVERWRVGVEQAEGEQEVEEQEVEEQEEEEEQDIAEEQAEEGRKGESVWRERLAKDKDEIDIRFEFERENRRRQEQHAVRQTEEAKARDKEMKLEETLEVWQRGCVVCHARGEQWYEGHGLAECKQEEKERVEARVQELRRIVRYEDYAACFECGCPQAICDGWEVREEGFGWQRGSKQCQFAGVLIEAVAAIWVIGEGKMDGMQVWIQEEMQIKGRGSREMGRWIGMKVVIGEIEVSRLCLILLKFGGERMWRIKRIK